MTPRLRDYQTHHLITPTREALRRVNSVVAVAATGAGKTHVGAYMAKGTEDRGKRALIINHSPEIHGQFLSALNFWGVQAGQIASKKTMTRERVQVGMIQTLINRLDILPRDFDLVIVDEAHHCAENNIWGKALRHPRLANATRVLLTATPQGLVCGRGLWPFADEIIQGVSSQELIEDGWLVFPHLRYPEKEVAERFRIVRGDFDKNQMAETFSRKVIVGDAFDHYRMFLDGLPTIVWCSGLKHAHYMRDQYEKASRELGKEWTHVVIEGGDKHRKQRDYGLRGLTSGSVQCVFFDSVLGEGVDVPTVIGLQKLRLTTSHARNKQVDGRVFRPMWPAGFDQYTSTREERLRAIAKSPKPQAIILDHAGNYYKHGHPIARQIYGLEDTKTVRYADGKEPKISRCPKCNSVWPGKLKRCPGILRNGEPCGYVFGEDDTRGGRKNPKVIEGLLREAGADEEDIQRLIKKVQAMDGLSAEAQRKQMLGSLRYETKESVDAMASAIGYRKNWTKIMYDRLNLEPVEKERVES